MGFITHKPRWKHPMVVVELNTCWVAKKIEPKHPNGFSENCTHFDFGKGFPDTQLWEHNFTL
jgi:hypothetical protein